MLQEQVEKEEVTEEELELALLEFLVQALVQAEQVADLVLERLQGQE